MADTENMIVHWMRKIDEKLDRIGEDVRELKTRTGLLEQQYASLSSRIDRIELRLDRIEDRLGLVEAG